jgi:hypothetical protein
MLEKRGVALSTNSPQQLRRTVEKTCKANPGNTKANSRSDVERERGNKKEKENIVHICTRFGLFWL